MYTVPGINTEAENVLEKCDEICANLKNISRVVIYKDVKKLLKSSICGIEKIKRKVAHGGFETAKIALSPAIDEEDRAFICENFMEIGSAVLNVNTITVSDISENIHQFPFSRYGIEELESVLASLGKN